VEKALLTSSLVVCWLWLGLASLMLLYLRVQLPTIGNELVFLWGWQELWLSPGGGGFSVKTAWLVINPMFVPLLWAKYRSIRARGGSVRPLVLISYLGTSFLLLLLQWALVSADDALPAWKVIQVFP